jgi:thiamine kinase-like enzyme
MVSEDDIKTVGKQFRIHGEFINAIPYGGGHINDTFAAEYNQGGAPMRYIFQRINHDIFKDPALLMENVSRVLSHSHDRLADIDDASRRALTLIPSISNQAYVIDQEDSYWRVYIFIEKAKTYDVVETEKQAFEAARAFGNFQKLLVDIPGERLKETIPDFHNTVQRYQTLVAAIEADSLNRAKDVQAEIDFITQRESDTSAIIDGINDGSIPERITHNDTKLNNIMIDEKTLEGICVIDLDTVMPGSALYDFGDLVRTSTSPALEDEQDLSKVVMQPDMFQALAQGYLKAARSFLTTRELELLPFSGKLITLEIGIRFLTDYLEGDVYFKIHREGHNLDRCRTQLKLVASIEEQMDAMAGLVEEFNR